MTLDSERMKTIAKQNEQWFSEIQKADARLRAFPDGNKNSNPNRPRIAAMRWAIALAKTKLDELSHGDLANLEREVACFGWCEMLQAPAPPSFVPPAPWAIPGGLASLQQWLQKTLQLVISRTVLTYRAPAREWHLIWMKEDDRWIQTYSETQREGPNVMRAIFDLVREQLENIRLCRRDDCPEIFVRDRSNQEFCSKRCQWRDAQRTAQNIAPDRYGKRGPKPTPPGKAKKGASRASTRWYRAARDEQGKKQKNKRTDVQRAGMKAETKKGAKRHGTKR